MTKTFEQVYNDFNIFMGGRTVAMDNITFPGDIYLFGIWSGVSAKLISDYLKDKQMPYDKMWGFDSFEGLPLETVGVPRYYAHRQGTYSSTSLYGVKIEEVVNLIYEGVGNPKLTLVPGFFDESLTPELAKDRNMGPASFVDVDVDLYGSTIEVLDFMAREGLLVRGTVIYFDDWGCTKEYEGGESRAWREIAEKYSIKHRQIYHGGERDCVNKVFVIDKI